MRKGHPIKGTSVSIEELCRHKHVRIPFLDCFEPLLESQALTRQFSASAENFLPIPFIISRTDLIGLILQSVFTVFKQVCNLRSVASKIDLPPYSVDLVFDRRKEINLGHRWLTDCITTVAREVARDLMLDPFAQKAARLRAVNYSSNHKSARSARNSLSA